MVCEVVQHHFFLLEHYQSNVSLKHRSPKHQGKKTFQDSSCTLHMCHVYGKSKHEKQPHLVLIPFDWPKEPSPETMLRSTHKFSSIMCMIFSACSKRQKDVWGRISEFRHWHKAGFICGVTHQPLQQHSWALLLQAEEARGRGSERAQGMISYPAKSLSAGSRWNPGLRDHSAPLSQLDPRLQPLGKCSPLSHPANFQGSWRHFVTWEQIFC